MLLISNVIFWCWECLYPLCYSRRHPFHRFIYINWDVRLFRYDPSFSIFHILPRIHCQRFNQARPYVHLCIYNLLACTNCRDLDASGRIWRNLHTHLIFSSDIWKKHSWQLSLTLAHVQLVTSWVGSRHVDQGVGKNLMFPYPFRFPFLRKICIQ